MDNKEKDIDERHIPIVPSELIEQRMKVGPRNITLSGAEHYEMDIEDHNAKPSQYGVDEMRDWSIVNEK